MSIASRRKNRPRPRVEALEARALLAVAGSLDPSFGGGSGHAAIPLFPAVSITDPVATVTASSVVVAPGGRIVESGTLVSGPVGPLHLSLEVAEFNADGTPVTSFGRGGLVEDAINIEGATRELPLATAVQTDGKIIEAFFGTPGYNGSDPLTVVRLDADGSLDPTFGTYGVALFPSNSSAANSNGVDPLTAVGGIVVQANGEIVLAGTAEQSATGNAPFGAMRLNANGSVDTTYGQGGLVNVAVGVVDAHTDDSVVGAELQSDGKVVVVGSAEVGINLGIGEFGTPIDAVAVLRLNTDGSLDMTYGGTSAQGIVLLQSNPADFATGGLNDARGAAIQPDDKVLISSYNSTFAGTTPPSENRLYRLNSAGTLDPTFGTAGLVNPVDSGQVTVQADSSIDVAGLTNPANFDYPPQAPSQAGPSFVAQFLANGTPKASFGNTTFGGVGVLQIPTPVITPSFLTFLNLAIQPSGDILVGGVGSVPTLSGRDFAFTVASAFPSVTTTPAAPPIESEPAAFDGSGLTNPAIYNIANGTFYYRTTGERDLQDLYDPFGSPGAGQSIPAAADYLGTGVTQPAVYLPTFGIYAVEASHYSPGLAIPFGIPGAGNTIPTPADFEGTGKADVAIYLPSMAAFAIIPSNGQPARFAPFGIAGPGQSIPAPADYYHTGQADVAVYLAQMGAFAVQDPTGKTAGEIVPFGMPGIGKSLPVPGDYDGSGKTEFAVYIPSLGAFFYHSAISNKDVAVPIGMANSGEIPAPGDYDGSGHTEVAIYDPAKAFIEYLPANGGPAVITYFGSANGGSVPVATPPGDLPQFSGWGSGSGAAGFRAGFAPAVVSATSTNVTRSSAVPVGPSPASFRIARTPINQAAPDSDPDRAT